MNKVEKSENIQDESTSDTVATQAKKKNNNLENTSKYPGIKTVIHGNGAVAHVMGHVCGGVIGYPITPSTEISEMFEAFRARGGCNVWGNLANDLVKNAGTGNPAAYKGAVGKIPGLDLDIFINSNCTVKSCTVGSSTGLAAVIGNGPVKVRSWDSEDLGAKMYQMDVFRQAVAPVFKNASSLNMSAYKLTACIA